MKKGLLIFGIILLVVFVQFLFKPLFGQLELLTYDMRAKISTDRGPSARHFKHADKKIVIVAIDDYSRNEVAQNPQLNLGSWPWRRDVWAEVVDFIEQGEPKAILFDIIFNDVNHSYSYDNDFARALRRYDNIVLASSLNNPKKISDKLKTDEIISSYFIPTGKPLNVEIDDPKIDDNITFYSHAPIYNMYTRYNTMGVVNKVVGSDSVIRSVQPIFKLVKEDETYYMPSLAFAGFLKYMGEDGKITIKNKKIFYKGREIPINNNATTLIGWHGTGKDYDYIPVSKILLNSENINKIDPEYFKDKIIIIGRTEAGTDIHASAVNPSYAGPEANAAAIDNFINDSDIADASRRKFISPVSQLFGYEMTIVLCLMMVLMILISKKPVLSIINSILFIMIYIMIAVYAFEDPTIRIWLPIIVPLYYMFCTAIVTYSFKLHGEAAKKLEIMNMFGKFVSPKVLSELMKSSHNLVLKNTKKHITIMFCDVKDFTKLSEKSNPEQLVENLNELFDEIVNVVFSNNGTVDKFVGDSVMAYWGDPVASEDDPYMAVKTALEIKKKVDELKIKNIKERKIVLDVKIGICTGEALLGLVGSQKIMSYTAMGDAVNSAARLESACSRLKRDILISKSTYDCVKDKIVAIDVGKIEVKGKNEQIEIYEPIGLVEDDKL